MTQQAARRKRTLRRTAVAVLRILVLGLAVHLLVPQITALEHSAEVLRSLAWYAVLLAVVAQSLSYVGSGYEVQQLLALFGQRISVARCLEIILASFSLSLVGGGQVAYSGSAFRWLRAAGTSADAALVAGILPAFINLLTIGALSVTGLLYLLSLHRLAPALVTVFTLAFALLVSAILFMWVGLRYRSWFLDFLDDLARLWTKLSKRPYDPGALNESAERLFRASDAMFRGGWRGPLLGDSVNVGFDILTLYLLFLAAHYTPSPGLVMAGYGLPLLAAKVTPLPGGLGVVEGGMVALYAALGLPGGVTVVVVLAYRLVSFWIPSVLGFCLVAHLEHRAPRIRDQEGVGGQAG